ncbi:MAG: alpha-2-macroglobulin family protein [Ferruginibacter sp.]
MNIYNLAVKDNNDAQQIKSSIYQIKYRQMVEEGSRENNIFFVDTLISRSKQPVKNILQSMQAEMFWHYLQNNRYKFYDRTKLTEEKSKDISTWSLEKLHNTISTLYKASLLNDGLLKQVKLEGFDPIIIKGENTRQLRPTLFDFLGHRALNYFMNDEQGLTKPAYHFIVDDPKVFAPVNEFVKTPFTTKDTTSLHFKAIKVLQDILSFHLNDAKSDALLDADLIRLNFANQYAVIENKLALYENALKNIETKYTNNPGAAQAMYLRALIYNNKGQSFDPLTNKDDQYEIKRAKETCEEAVKKYPASEGAANCQNLVAQILQPSLNLATEKVNLPGQPFRTLVSYKNVKTVYFRMIKITKEEIKKLDRRNNEKYWKDIVALRSAKSWSATIPDLQDYQNHSVEIKVEPLPSGTYFLLASLDESFSLQKNIIARQMTYVSNISYIHNDKNEYYVLHRDNGKPLANTQVQIWETKYNYTKSQNDEVKAESYTTDKNGYFKLKTIKEYRSFTMQFKTRDEELFLDENDYNNYYNSIEPEIKPVTFLFTDRAIYRPGQTVYFKGIVLKNGNKASETTILPGFNSTVQLKDANGQKVSELKMTSNEYGSYHGSFKLPEGILNGQFSIHDETTSTEQYFSVEEYKRPKFNVEVKKPIGSYRVNDSIKVTGTAKAYAGNNIDGAKVSYRVVRKVRYRIFDYVPSSRKIMPPGRPADEMEISNGETVTDHNGEFFINFKALPDERINKKNQPTFYYEVSADITDLNGETRSGTTWVAVAYHSLQLEINVAEKLPIDSLKKIYVKSTNLNDIEEKVVATLSIQKLKSPDRIFRERYWQQPDQFIMSRDEYYSYFPYDVYKDEDEVKNYTIDEKILEKTDSTNQQWIIATGKLKQGWYKITAIVKDKNGEEVKTEKYIELTDSNQGTNEPVTVAVSKPIAEPGEKINYNISTAFQNVWLIQTLSKMDKSVAVNYLTVKSNQSFNDNIAVTEADRGGIAMSYAFVQHNRVYKGNEAITVPWSNKELDISYSTFRDKILPGSEEKWTVKISGNKGEKVTAEILAAMYDASLDQFKPHSWSALDIWPRLYNNVNWTEQGFSAVNSEEYNRRDDVYVSAKPKSYDQLLGLSDDIVVIGYGTKRRKIVTESATEELLELRADGMIASAPEVNQTKFTPPKIVKDEEIQNDTTIGVQPSLTSNTPTNAIQVRKNFNETAFFFPDLKTDADGNVSFNFTIPEALTEWKLMTLAHTKNLASGYSEKKVITQKPLMVQPNAPRFVREGDQMEFTAKVVNLSDTEVNGISQLELLDATTNKPIDNLFKNVTPTKNFTIAAGQSAAVKFSINVPLNFNSALTYRITAKSKEFSDGEEMALSVLTNRMLVTESMPLNLRNTTTKDFKFGKLINNNSSTITNHALTVEYTSNPVWYAVQAIPYLMEYPYDCAEQTFNRYYANILAAHITNSNPRIKAVFEKWKYTDTAALLSNLEKNQELKSALLEETPWVLNAQTETQQKKNIALLFDMVKMSSETDKAINKLQEMQSSNGGFVWFKGGPDDRYMTQYIVTGIGHLKKLNAMSNANVKQLQAIKAIVDKAIPYLDTKIKEDYNNLIKNKAKLSNNNLGYMAIHYLYMRSFFSEYNIPATSQTAYNYYKGQEKKYWLNNNKYMQAMIALTLNRANDKTTALAITRSLKENSISSEEMGMYWKEWTTGGYYWHQAPIESQAMMIEAFNEINKDIAVVDDLKTWLLKQKQTQNWRTTKATAEACYALLLTGSKELNEEKEVVINLGGTILKSTDAGAEAGTGYFKKTLQGSEVKPAMGNINVSIKSVGSQSNKQTSTSWGSVYWQYFEDLDKITPAATPLKLTKKLFVEKNTDKGPALQAIGEGAALKIGDKVKVRIELKVDRDMEYVHMKDMRAASMEPVNVLSGYKYQGGLGYYESTKDASTNFFFGWLPKGSYVFEYSLFVGMTGNFSNGITTIQSMYAPEFSSHSEGTRVEVKAN